MPNEFRSPHTAKAHGKVRRGQFGTHRAAGKQRGRGPPKEVGASTRSLIRGSGASGNGGDPIQPPEAKAPPGAMGGRDGEEGGGSNIRAPGTTPND